MASGQRRAPLPAKTTNGGPTIFVGVIVPLLSLLVAVPARPQVVDPHLWNAGIGNVTAMARSGDTLYVGGTFNQVGPNTGSGVPVQYGGGGALPRYPKVNGEILTAISDSAGGWFIGGLFTAVGGQPRRHLAHIFAGGEVAAWSPDPNDQVHALALSGATLYVGGRFDSIATLPRSRIAAVDVATGAARRWDPSATGNLYGLTVVSALAVRGDTVYAGGNFLSIGGQTRHYLAGLDARSGQALAWDPSPDLHVNAIVLDGDSAYVGGAFWRVGGQSHFIVARVSLTTGGVAGWDPRITHHRRNYWEPDPEIRAMVLRGGRLYLGGQWDSLGGQFRSGLGAVDAVTGAVTPWDPRPAGVSPPAYVNALAARGDTIYVGGYFSTLQGVARICLAGVDATTGIPTAWDPRPNNEVNAVAIGEDAIYAAGYCTSLGPWQPRSRLAAFDLTTGLPTDWDPDPDGIGVLELAVKDGIVYAGGEFGFVGGQPRSRVAALDGVTGAATAWNPSANGAVQAMVLRGDTLYVGGDFTNIGGQPRRHLAALDLRTGLATDWDPNAGNGAYIKGLVLAGSTIYVGGGFVTMGPELRTSLAAVDAGTGAVLPWQAKPTGPVNAMTLSNGKLYVAGSFDTIAGVPRTSVAALDPITGAVYEWNPAPVRAPNASYGPPRIYAIASLGRDIFIGGEFSRIGGGPRSDLAVVDDSLGLATAWDPRADYIVWSLLADESTVFAGGWFRTIDGLATAGLARISFPVPPAPPPPPLALAQSAPNPARTTAIIHFSLPAAGPVTLEVFDIQGRRVATLLDRQVRAAGPHDFLVRADRWGSGAYFYRLEAAGRSATRKMIVIE